MFTLCTFLIEVLGIWAKIELWKSFCDLPCNNEYNKMMVCGHQNKILVDITSVNELTKLSSVVRHLCWDSKFYRMIINIYDLTLNMYQTISVAREND